MKNASKKRIAATRPTIYALLLLLLTFAAVWRAGDAAAQPEPATDVEKAAESEIFGRFDDWVAQYLSGDFPGDREFLQAGVALAERRREIFRQLIRTNPRAAVEKAIKAETQSLLPAEINRLLEKSVAGRGAFDVLVVDELDPAGAERHRIEREVVIDGARFEAFVFGRRAAMTTKIDIPLRGVYLDGLIAVDETAVRRLAPAEIPARRADGSKIAGETVVAEVGAELAYFKDESEFEGFVRELEAREAERAPSAEPQPWTIGTKRLLFIRVDFPDRKGVPVDRNGIVLTEQFSQNLLDGPVNDFYYQNSYGKTSLRATVTPVVRMPLPQTAYPRESLFALLTDARNAARAAGYETNDYELDMVAFARSDLLDFSGISPIANKGALINGNFTFKVVTHELGHAFGLLHANLWRTFDGSITGSGANVEYGDDFDMMGRGATLATHFNANYKRSLDWLTDENVQTVTRPGVYRVFAHDTVGAGAPQGVRALKIKKDTAKNYWVEFRQLLTHLPDLSNGATIRWDYPLDVLRQTQILDMKPATTSLEDSALTIGQTFSDEATGLKITILGKGGTTPESLDVKVDFNFSVVRGAPFDFDGDRKSDVGVFRPADGSWWYARSSASDFRVFSFGAGTDVIAPGDYTGDGKADLAVWRPSTGEWYIQRSENNSYFSFPFGQAGDIPAPSDYDGDGKTDAAVYRPATGTWFILNSGGSGTSIVGFGAAEDKPVAADYDGDGRTDVAIFRPSDGSWWYLQSSNLQYRVFRFGVGTDVPVPGDYTGDGAADLAVFRPSTGEWYFQRSEDNSYFAVPFGAAGDLPAPGDYDGDGRFDTAVFRPSTGEWFVERSGAGTMITNFGAGGDRPIPGAFVR
ncbi:MAG TPA: FG-GAP-like repeat-containing protein [Pyrinomonadaceae bacterium]|jgi:hypothetical protein